MGSTGTFGAAFRSLTSVLAAAFLIGGCDLAQVGERLSQGEGAVDDDPCTNCIEFEKLLHLGADENEGYVVATARGAMDRMGRIWLGQYRDMVKVYAPSGSPIQTVGRRGQGPGEFTLPNHFIPLADGGMLIGDAAQGRLTRFSSDMTFLGSRRMPVGASEVAELPDGRLVVNTSRTTADGMGEPLHILSRDSVLRSFGRGDVGVVDPREMKRKIATDDAGHIYSVAPDRYQILVWDGSGEPIGEINGSPLQQPPEELAESEPGSRIEALSVEGGRLWVLVHELREDWRSNSVDVGSGPARRLLPKGQDVTKWFRARIDIFDVHNGHLLASTRAPGLLAAFIGPSMALENRLDEAGRPTIVVWRLYARFPQQEQ